MSESFEKCGLHREALDAVGKYEKMPEFVRLSDRAQMSILIRLESGSNAGSGLVLAGLSELLFVETLRRYIV